MSRIQNQCCAGSGARPGQSIKAGPQARGRGLGGNQVQCGPWWLPLSAGPVTAPMLHTANSRETQPSPISLLLQCQALCCPRAFAQVLSPEKWSPELSVGFQSLPKCPLLRDSFLTSYHAFVDPLNTRPRQDPDEGRAQVTAEAPAPCTGLVQGTTQCLLNDQMNPFLAPVRL